MERFDSGNWTIQQTYLSIVQINPSTKIGFYLHSNDRVTLSVYDPQERLVTTIVDGVCRAGWNEIEK